MHSMRGNLDKYRSDLQRLGQLGEDMLLDLSLRDSANGAGHQEIARELHGRFERDYQRWYTEAAAVVQQIIPGRAAEFQQLYRDDGKRRSNDRTMHGIQDWLTGRCASRANAGGDRSDHLLAVSLCLKTQIEILQSAAARFESSLFDIRQLLQADMFDSEIEAARELAKQGFSRAAGSIAGVVLEKHLRQVLAHRGIPVRKAEPTLNDFNDLLKKADAVDVPGWRKIQRLVDIRNLCGHSKQRDPSDEEVGELIEGVDKIVQTLF